MAATSLKRADTTERSQLAVEIRGLSKSFGRTKALDGLDLSVAPGDITGFLGPNGAGKSTTIRVLLGLLRADGGTVRRAYLEKSKRFHPDAWFRRDVGGFGPLLSKWFQRLSAAYQVLSDEESRAGYDRDHRAELSKSDRAALERRELSLVDEERRARERRERMLRTKGFARIGAAREVTGQRDRGPEGDRERAGSAGQRAAASFRKRAGSAANASRFSSRPNR